MQSIIEDIRSNSFKNIYLLYGDESYLIHQYRDNLIKALSDPSDTMNLSVFDQKKPDVNEIIGIADTLPFFAERRVIVIDDSGYCLKVNEEFNDYLDRMPESTFFVFCETEIDKRNKMFKKISKIGRAVEFSRQTEKTLKTWILGRLKNENKKIKADTLDLFLEYTGDDMEWITKELEKLLCYTLNSDVITSDDVRAVCCVQVENSIFAMVDAISNADKKTALDLYYDLLLLKEPPMRILALITKQFHRLYQISRMDSDGFSPKEMAARIKIPDFAVRKNLKQMRRFSSKELREALEKCVEMEESFKCGKIKDQLAVELLIIELSTKNSR